MIYPVPKSLSHTIIELHPSAIPCEIFPLSLENEAIRGKSY